MCKQNTCISFKFWPCCLFATHLLLSSVAFLSTRPKHTNEKKRRHDPDRLHRQSYHPKKDHNCHMPRRTLNRKKYLWPEHTKMPNAVYKFVYWHVRSQIALWKFFFCGVADAAGCAGCHCFTSIFAPHYLCAQFLCLPTSFSVVAIRCVYLRPGLAWSGPPLFHAYCRSTHIYTHMYKYKCLPHKFS